jgi:predicted phosphodiesterase
MNGPSPWEVFEVIDALSPEVWIKGNTDEWLERFTDDATATDDHSDLIIERNKYARSRLTSKQVDKLSKLQEQSVVIVNDKKILCVHGSPNAMDENVGIMSPMEYFEELIEKNTFDLMLCGHTHLPFIGFYKGKKIMNPGGIGFSLDEDPRASYGILTIGNKEFSLSIQRVCYETGPVIDLAKERDFPYFDIYKNLLETGKNK